MQFFDYHNVEGYVARIKQFIDMEYYDVALANLRTLAEHISLWYIYDAGLWDDACKNKDGTQFDRPKFANSIYLLKNKKIITKELRTLFESIKNFGGDQAAHSVEGEERDATYLYGKLKDEMEGFLIKFPYASEMSSSSSYEALQKAACGPVPAEAKPKPGEAKPKSVEAKPKSVEAKSKSVEAKPKSEEAKPKPEEARPKPVKVNPKPVETKSKPEEAKPKSEEAKPKPEEAKPKPEETKPKPVLTAEYGSIKESDLSSNYDNVSINGGSGINREDGKKSSFNKEHELVEKGSFFQDEKQLSAPPTSQDISETKPLDDSLTSTKPEPVTEKKKLLVEARDGELFPGFEDIMESMQDNTFKSQEQLDKEHNDFINRGRK